MEPPSQNLPDDNLYANLAPTGEFICYRYEWIFHYFFLPFHVCELLRGLWLMNGEGGERQPGQYHVGSARSRGGKAFISPARFSFQALQSLSAGLSTRQAAS